MTILASVRRDLETTGAAGAALLVLFLGVVTNRYRFEPLPLRPHPEHFALVIGGLVLGWLVWNKRAQIRFQASDVLLAVYLALALASSFLFPAQPRESVQYWTRMLASVAVYFVTRWLISGSVDAPRSSEVGGTSVFQCAAFRLGVKALLIFGVLEAWFGIAAWFLYPLGMNLGVDEYPLGVRGPGGILCNFSLTMYGTLWEPNAFGSVLMTVILVGATLFVSDEFRAWRRRLGIALAVMLAALSLNAGRGALGGLFLGFVLILFLARGMTFLSRLKWLGGAVLLIVLVNVPSLNLSRALMQLPTAPGLAARAPCAEWIARGMPRGTATGDPLIDPSTGPESNSVAVNRLLEGQTLASRWVSYQQAWADFVERPLFGNGADSFGQKYTTTAHTPGWISNLFLMSLHDTGIIGTLTLTVWLAWYAATVYRGWRQTLDGAQAAMLLAAGIGLLCLFVTYQVTTMLWFGFIWWYFAVLEVGAVKVHAPAVVQTRPALVHP